MIVYVLTNPAMPGLVKIGWTGQNDVKVRMSQLYGVGVPVPFDVEFAAEVDDAPSVEAALHTAFAPNRVNPKREFFQIDPEQAIAILRLLERREATADVKEQQDTIDEESIAAGIELSRKHPVMNLQEMNIPVGSVLHFTRSDATAIVIGPRKVRHEGREVLLSPLTKELLQYDYNVRPALYWTYSGRLLVEIYNETYLHA